MPSPRSPSPPSRGRRPLGALAFAGVVLAGAVLAFALVQGVFWLLGDPDGGRLAGFLGAFLVLANACVQPLMARRVRRRLATKDRVVCSIRVLEGHQDGLTRRWRSGVAALSPGQIDFRRTLGGPWPQRRRPVTLKVTVVPGPPRTTTGAESLLVIPECRIVRLTTPSAVLEWAVAPVESIDWATDLVQGH